MRIFLLATALLLSGANQAAVYKCKNTNGAIEFQDKPCAPGSGGEIAVKGVAPAAAASRDGARGGGTGGDSAALTGLWCEYAVSLDVDGEKDESSPAQWNFGSDTVEYGIRGRGMIKAKLAREGGSFSIDNAMLGGGGQSWEIHSIGANSAVVRGPMGGYFHMRRGGCR